MKLIDYSFSRPGGKSIKEKEYSGVLRYLSYSPGKNLSTEELKDLQDNNLAVGLVWEQGAKNALNGKQQGKNDATEAIKQAESLGFPNDRPIYFAIDFDSTPEQQIQIDEYLLGCASIIGENRTGVYGSFYVIERCHANNTASWFWQTLAWSGGQISSHCHIYQNGQGDFNGGADVDEAKQEDWGGWQCKEKLTPNPALVSSTINTETSQIAPVSVPEPQTIQIPTPAIEKNEPSQGTLEAAKQVIETMQEPTQTMQNHFPQPVNMVPDDPKVPQQVWSSLWLKIIQFIQKIWTK